MLKNISPRMGYQKTVFEDYELGILDIEYDQADKVFWFGREVEIEWGYRDLSIYLESKDMMINEAMRLANQMVSESIDDILRDAVRYAFEQDNGFELATYAPRELVVEKETTESEIHWSLYFDNIQDGYTQIVVGFENGKPVAHCKSGIVLRAKQIA